MAAEAVCQDVWLYQSNHTHDFFNVEDLTDAWEAATGFMFVPLTKALHGWGHFSSGGSGQGDLTRPARLLHVHPTRPVRRKTTPDPT